MKHLPLFFVLALAACTSPESNKKDNDLNNQASAASEKVTFDSKLIADDANLWWARTFSDVNGDGYKDIILQDNNGSGGWLGYLAGTANSSTWDKHIIFEEAPGGGKFAAGDLEAADLDGDGDVDLIGVEHPGEWTDADAEAILYAFYQNDSEWSPVEVGTIPSALKDISIADLNDDGIPEIITVTYNAETLTVFSKNQQDNFIKVKEWKITNLHEGLDVGDLDGDGKNDIAANGYWLKNPGSLEQTWPLDTIDSRWFSQEEDHWARNATKVVCQDTDGNGKAEVFISHSEKEGYPIMKYEFDGRDWQREEVLESLPAAHSLQVADVDLDGEYEVLTGVNRNRAINIAEENNTTIPDSFPVLLLDKRNGEWYADTLNTEGVYNLLAGDFEGDGDIDLIRLTSHDMKDMYLMLNQLN